MKSIEILKATGILLLIIYTILLLFYLGIVVPEYCACNDAMYEGQRGTDIWGNEVLCDGESMAFGKVFFQLITYILGGLSIILALISFFIYRLK